MRIASDQYIFDVVWKGSWYRLAPLSWHNKKGVDLTKPLRILFDNFNREHLVPMSEFKIPPNPLA